jgi:hypothetical protein
MPDAGSSASTFASQAIASIMTTFETTGSSPARQRFLQVIVSQMSVSEICLDADVIALREVAGPGVSRRRSARRLGPNPIAGTATGGAALQLAQPDGYRIRHEDEKNLSAIWMRILQSCSCGHRHMPRTLGTYRQQGVYRFSSNVAEFSSS